MPAKKPPEGYISPKQAGKILGCSGQNVYHLANEGRIKARKEVSGKLTFYYLEEKDVERYAKKYRSPLRGRPKRRYDLYEIVIICCGKLDVLFSTSSPIELSHMYIKMLEHDNKLIRVRADGELLTIRESDKLGNAYHPRHHNKEVI